jgi:hypothetical protein
MATIFARRQFNTVPTENWPVGSPETGTYLVAGTVSTLFINNTRTNLANDDLYGNAYGWFPSPDLNNYGIIAQGNDAVVANTQADGSGVGYISFYGWDVQENQSANDAAFIDLANYVLGTTGEDDLVTLKENLTAAGFYYQYPVGYDGQSPGTGTGSDVL